jgi:hypothetical protein
MTPEETVEVSTTEEIRVPATLWARIWGNTFAKELMLFVVSTLAVQLAFGFNDLVKAIDTADNWETLLTSFKAWGAVFAFSAFKDIFKQTTAFLASRLAGTQL